MPNKFIVLEAINAAGKTTQFNLLIKALKNSGYNVHHWHFHQRNQATGQLIEHKFLHSNSPLARFTRREQALLFIQDIFTRADEINKFRHAAGSHIIITDRYYTANLAYQTIGLSGQKRQAMIKWIKWLCEEGKPKMPKPDQVILLDTPVNISLKHLAKSQGKKDHFETKQKLIAVRRSYLRLAKEESWTIINSVNDRGVQRSINSIHHEIWQHLTPARQAPDAWHRRIGGHR